MGLLSFFFNKKSTKAQVPQSEEIFEMSYDNQISSFQSLGYVFDSEVTKEMILGDVFEMSIEEDAEKYIEKNPYSVLYYIYGWRNPAISNYNYTEKCLSFDLEYFDPNLQYKWFMERLGAITNGEINFTDIVIENDSKGWEWIVFKVNSIPKKWKLERTNYIADHFVQRFSYLTKELNTKGRYTYYNDDSQLWVIDYATEEEQIRFNKTTGLIREWLGEGNHFSEPPRNHE